MDERDRAWFNSERKIMEFMNPLRKSAVAWLEQEIYPSEEYQKLASRLNQTNELNFARQVMSIWSSMLALMELLRAEPEVRTVLNSIMQPLAGFSAPLHRRIRRILQWDMQVRPTEFLWQMFVEERRDQKAARQREIFSKPEEVEHFQRTDERIDEINELATGLLFSIYNKYEGVQKIILLNKN